MDSQSLQEKIAFFAQLDALDHLSDGDDEVDEREQDHRRKCRAFFSSRKKPASVSDESASNLRRTGPMPPSTAATPGPQVIEATPRTRSLVGTRAKQLLTGTASVVEETPVPDSAHPPPPRSLRRSTTLPLPAPPQAADQSPSAGSAMRKRKRQSSTKSAPEAPRIFGGLSFYYIPNNDVAPARKLRIEKAQAHGAQWVRDLQAASHVVVDKHLKYQDVERVLGSHASQSLVVVNEEYPIDCILFRTLLNPDQNRYRVPGCPAPTGRQPVSDQEPPASSQASHHSLRLREPPTSRRQDPVPPGDESPRRRQSLPPNDAESSHDREGDGAFEPATDHAATLAADAEPPGLLAREQKPAGAASSQVRQNSGIKDELSEYIEVVQQYKDLPLDTDEEDLQSVQDIQEEASESESELEVSSEDERARKRSKAKGHRGVRKQIPFEERFACNHGGTKDKAANAQNPNARTIEVLQSMCDYYSRINDHWRATAYRKAIATLRRQSVKITTEEQAYCLPNIGPRLAAKIEEIVSTNRLRRLDYANDEPLDRALETFLKIYGVGINRANKWIAQGFRTLDDLRQKADLTPNQRISIDHYDDLNTRIPRHEVTALFAYVQREAAQLDPAVELVVGGSYRRGSDSSGDIDIIVTKKGTTSSADLVPFLEELVAVLTRKGFLVATLAALHADRPGKDGPGSKWHGCCVLPREGGDGAGEKDAAPRPVWRRIDFLLVPESEYGAALIYFTGNDIFNRSMRLLASRKGMRLNQRGLYKEVMRGKGRVKITEGDLLEGRDERRIFELLGVKWREPWERWC